MAEVLGLIASSAGIAAFGAKLSLSLFEFASLVGGAREEVQSIGLEIALFSSVLRQISTSLESPKSMRFTSEAIGTTGYIVSRCDAIFSEISGVLGSLRLAESNETAKGKGNGGGGGGGGGFIAKVKWAFQRQRVQLLRGSLDSMKMTLQLMLTVLELSGRAITPRTSVVGGSELGPADAEDAESVIAESLLIAQHVTLEKLHELESAGDDPEENRQFGGIAASGAPEVKRDSEVLRSAASSASTLGRRASLESLSSLVKEEQHLLADKWTESSEVDFSPVQTSDQPAVRHPNGDQLQRGRLAEAKEKKESGAQPSLIQTLIQTKKVSRWSETSPTYQKYKNSLKVPPPASKEPAIANGGVKVTLTLSEELIRQRNPSGPNNNLTDTAPTIPQPSSRPFPSSFERWETLSAQFEGLMQFWIGRLQQNTDNVITTTTTTTTGSGPGSNNPVDPQALARQVRDLAAASDNLFKAVVEMQRLRVASERKYHRWFFETRAELEAGGEAKATLEMELRRMSERAAGLEASVATLTSAKARLEEVVAERGEAGAVLTRRVDGLKVLLREERGRVVGLPRDGEGGMRGDRREVLERALRTALEHEGAERAILEAGIQREREVARELRTLLAGERQMLVEERRRSEAVQGQLDKERERRARAVRHLMGNGSGVSES